MRASTHSHHSGAHAALLLLSCPCAQVDPEALKDGEVLVELLYLSLWIPTCVAA